MAGRSRLQCHHPQKQVLKNYPNQVTYGIWIEKKAYWAFYKTFNSGGVGVLVLWQITTKGVFYSSPYHEVREFRYL